MQQHRRLWSISAFLMIGLVGCGIDDETAVQDRRTDKTIPIGYYSNEKHESKGGNALLLDGADNDGPATEIMDHTLGVERETNKRFLRVTNNDNQANNTDPLTNRNPDHVNSGEAILGGSDKNYHGHLNNSQLPTRQSYYNGYEGKFSERVTRVTESVENVKEARTIIYGKNVVIAVRLDNNAYAEETKRNIQQAILPHVNGRTVDFLTTESQFNRIKAIDNDLRNGGPKEQLNKDIQNITQVKTIIGK